VTLLNKLQKTSFLAALIHRYSATLVVQLSAFIVGMVVSKLLGPEMLGYWGLFLIITKYYSFTNLGATNGLTRELGLAIGQKDTDKMHKTIGAAHAIQWFLPGTVSVGLIIYSFFVSNELRWIFLFGGIICFIQLYEVTLERIINAHEKHKTIAWLSVIRAILSFLIVIPLVFYFDLNGRIFAAMLLAVVVFVITWTYLPVKIGFSFDKTDIKQLIYVGFPIALSGFLAANFFLVDRIVVTRFLSISDLGLYTFAFYLVTVIKNVKTTIATILYQRQNIIFGEDGPLKKRRLLIVSKSAAFFTTDLTGIISGFLLIVFSFAVIHFMPEYKEALNLTYIIVFSQVLGNINVLNTVGRQVSHVKLLAIGLMFNIILSITFVHTWGLTGVAYATYISFVALNILINLYNLSYFSLDRIKSFFITFRIVGVSIYCFLIAKIIERGLFYFLTNHVVKDVFIMLAFLMAYAILMLPLFLLVKDHMRLLNKITLNQ
jgi:O-antigen/teichoic acid export membrane protein